MVTEPTKKYKNITHFILFHIRYAYIHILMQYPFATLLYVRYCCAFKQKLLQAPLHNEVKSRCLHPIRSSYTHGISCSGVVGVRKEAKRERSQHIKEVRTLKAKVND